MKIFIIISSLIIAMISGYFFHSIIDTLKEEEIIFTKYFFTSLPPNVIRCILFSILFFVMGAFLLIVTI